MQTNCHSFSVIVIVVVNENNNNKRHRILSNWWKESCLEIWRLAVTFKTLLNYCYINTWLGHFFCMWLCKHYLEQGHFNSDAKSTSHPAQMKCKCRGKEGCFSCFPHICLGCKLINVVMLEMVSVTEKRGDFCQESGETIAVFPFSHWC